MLYQQISKNKQKTVWLILLFCLLVLAIGWAIGYLMNGDMYSGAIIAAVVLLIYVPISYASSSRQVLAMSHAKEADPDEYAELYNIVEELTIPARLPMPKVYIVNDAAPNAFATGLKPEKAAVAVTTGLLDVLNREELEGVIAHELGHIRNFDIRLMTISIALVGVIILIAELGSRLLFFGDSKKKNNNQNPILMVIALVLVIIGPVLGQLMQLAISRNREYLADASAVEFTRNPEGLIRALSKISGSDQEMDRVSESTAGMYIASPFKKKKQKTNWMSTHPPIETRIERLSDM